MLNSDECGQGARKPARQKLKSQAVKGCLGWGSAVAVATAALMGAMSTVPAAAQEYRTNDTRIDGGGESATSRTLVLPIGKAAVVDLPRAAADILVSDPAVVEAVIRTPRRIYVMGRTAGVTNAFFFDSRDGQILNLEIRVEQDGKVIEDLIRKLVPTARVDVETMGQGIVLSGTADTPADAARAVEIAERFVSEDGSSAGPAALTGGGVMNMISVREPAQVMLKVRILEMQRRLVRQLGLDLDGVARIDDSLISFAVGAGGTGAAGGGISGVVQTGGIGDLSTLDAALNAFERNSLIKTLAEPSLVALSGEEAEFFAGGRVGFPVIQTSAAGAAPIVTVQFQPFGIELKFQPTVRSKGSINMVLGTSVSEVNPSLGFGDIPGFQTRSATTTVDLPSGASFAIAGLLQQDIQQTVEGVPALKETPILGQLFRSQAFESEETELVIIATPYLVEPSTLAELTDPAQGYVPPTMLQSTMLGRLESVYGVTSSGVSEARLQGPLGFILD